jgi:hypothetical protein
MPVASTALTTQTIIEVLVIMASFDPVTTGEITS